MCLDGNKVREHEAAFYYDERLQNYIGLRLDQVRQRDVLRDTGRNVCGYVGLRKQYDWVYAAFQNVASIFNS